MAEDLTIGPPKASRRILIVAAVIVVVALVVAVGARLLWVSEDDTRADPYSIRDTLQAEHRLDGVRYRWVAPGAVVRDFTRVVGTRTDCDLVSSGDFFNPSSFAITMGNALLLADDRPFLRGSLLVYGYETSESAQQAATEYAWLAQSCVGATTSGECEISAVTGNVADGNAALDLRCRHTPEPYRAELTHDANTVIVLVYGSGDRQPAATALTVIETALWKR